MPQWDRMRIEQVRKKVAKEALRAAGRLGARAVISIAFFTDQDGVSHMIDAGQSVIPLHEVYERLLAMIYAEMEQEGQRRAAVASGTTEIPGTGTVQ